MLNQFFKITLCCVFAWSLSSKGQASPTPLHEEENPFTLPLSSFALSSEDPLSAESIETPSSSSPSSSTKRKVKRVKSSKSKDTAQVNTSPPLSQNMQVDSAPPLATLFSMLTADSKPKVMPATSQNAFAPEELLPVHLILALLANETKITTKCPHPIVYLPDCDFFIGFKDMIYGKKDDFKKALSYDTFKQMPNILNALELLCVGSEEDFEKIYNLDNIQMAKELLTESQDHQWYQTHIKAMLGGADLRLDPNTLGYLQGQESTKSNFATYALYSHGRLFEPERASEKTSKKLKKDKKKIPEELPQISGIQVSLSVSKVVPLKKTKRKGSNPSTPRKRSGSKNTKDIVLSSSSITPSSPRESSPLTNSHSHIEENSSIKQGPEDNELMTKPTPSSMEQEE